MLRFLPRAVRCHQHLLDLPTASINRGKQRNPSLESYISRNFICLSIGMVLPKIARILLLLVGLHPSNTKTRPLLARQLYLVYAWQAKVVEA